MLLDIGYEAVPIACLLSYQDPDQDESAEFHQENQLCCTHTNPVVNSLAARGYKFTAGLEAVGC